jgi:hypothetical protein
VAVQTIATAVGNAAAVVIIPSEAYAMPGSVGTTVSNIGANPVFIGPAGVTATTGVQVAAGQNLNLPTLNSVLYGICAAAQTTNVVVGLFS